MSESRRDFLARTAAGLVGAAAAGPVLGKQQPSPEPTPSAAAGTPPAFGTAPPVGPEVGVATISEAEKLVRIELTPPEKKPRKKTVSMSRTRSERFASVSGSLRWFFTTSP